MSDPRSNSDAQDMPPLPPPPEKPDPGDCCGSGCDPCILELYEEQLERWEARVEAIKRRHQSQQ